MIIENSFFKIPEILHNLKSANSNQRIKEAALVNYFSMAIIAEFNSRNIENPFKNIQTEKHFPKKSKNCDIFVSLKGIFDEDFRKNYSVSEENYCEVKFFFGYDKSRANVAQTTTENVGYVLNDVSRLQHYTSKDNGRYFLVYFDSDKWNYLAKTKSKKKARQWLIDIFSPGHHRVQFETKGEPKSITTKIETKADKFDLEIITHEICSAKEASCFNGYLINVLNNAGNGS